MSVNINSALPLLAELSSHLQCFASTLNENETQSSDVKPFKAPQAKRASLQEITNTYESITATYDDILHNPSSRVEFIESINNIVKISQESDLYKCNQTFQEVANKLHNTVQKLMKHQSSIAGENPSEYSFYEENFSYDRFNNTLRCLESLNALQAGMVIVFSQLEHVVIKNLEVSPSVKIQESLRQDFSVLINQIQEDQIELDKLLKNHKFIKLSNAYFRCSDEFLKTWVNLTKTETINDVTLYELMRIGSAFQNRLHQVIENTKKINEFENFLNRLDEFDFVKMTEFLEQTSSATLEDFEMLDLMKRTGESIIILQKELMRS